MYECISVEDNVILVRSVEGRGFVSMGKYVIRVRSVGMEIGMGMQMGNGQGTNSPLKIPESQNDVLMCNEYDDNREFTELDTDVVDSVDNFSIVASSTSSSTSSTLKPDEIDSDMCITMMSGKALEFIPGMKAKQ